MGKNSYGIDWTPEQSKTNKQANTQRLVQVNFAQQGWQCPICKRVLAPFVIECPCGGQGIKNYWTVDTTMIQQNENNARKEN